MFESNNGSVYYQLSCGVPSASSVNLSTNNGSNYYYLSANDFILWGQSTRYIHPSSNNGSQNYFPVCSAPSDPGLDLESNNGTKFYYNSAFNCVSFCASNPIIPDILITGTLNPNATGTYSFFEYDSGGTVVWKKDGGSATIYWSYSDNWWTILYPTVPGFVSWVSDITTLEATPLPSDATNWVAGLAVIQPPATGTPILSAIY